MRAGYGRSFTPAGLGAVFGQAPDYDPPITNPQQLSCSQQLFARFLTLSRTPIARKSDDRHDADAILCPDGLNTYYFFNPPSAYRIPLADSWNLTLQHQFTPTLDRRSRLRRQRRTSFVRQSQRKPGRTGSELC